MKKIFTRIFISSFIFSFIALPYLAYAGAVLPNAIVNDTSIITITQASAGAKFQAELDKIPGLSAKNARLAFTKQRGVEGTAYPVDVDMLKIEGFNSDSAPFIGTTTGSMHITGTLFARDGKIGFNPGTITPATLNIFHVERAIENVMNSYIGSSYIGSVEVNNTQILAHVMPDPNPNVSSNPSPSSPVATPSSKIIPDCNVTGDTEVDGFYLKFRTPCDFDTLIQLVENVINFLLFYFATPLAAIIFAYAGFLYIFSSANEHNKSHAKAIVGKVFIGYVIALAAWLLINTILSLLLTDEAMKWTFLR